MDCCVGCGAELKETCESTRFEVRAVEDLEGVDGLEGVEDLEEATMAQLGASVDERVAALRRLRRRLATRRPRSLLWE